MDRTTTTLFAAAVTLGALIFVTGYRSRNPVAARIRSPHDELTARDLSLTPSDGDHDDGTVVYLVISPDCPISTSLIPELNRLVRDFSRTGVEFRGLVPGTVASADETQQHLSCFAISFPVSRDPGNLRCREIAATHTPQAVVYQDGQRIYSGRINNQYPRIGQKRLVVTRHDLQDVLQALAEHRPVPAATTPLVGCLIPGQQRAAARAADEHTELTYNRDVAPLLLKHCAPCHHPGEVAPFSLLTFDDAVQHADQIAEVVADRLMPPWKAAPDFGTFANEHRLTEREITVITEWVRSPQREGIPEDQPPAPEFSTDWYLGPPDLELTMPEAFAVPADGPDIYRHFIIPTGLTQNRLVSAVDFRPGAPQVVHHSIMYYDTTGEGRRLDAEDPGPGYNRVGSPGFAVSGSLGGWGPGGRPRRLPAGTGRPLEQGADLIVQIHYHPNGRPAEDRSRIGLYFAPPESSHPVTEIMVADVNLRIPAGAERHHHQAEYTLPVDTILFDATPHMHVLGREVQAVAIRPDGTEQPLIRIPDWDFYWQDNYVFAEPVKLPAGTRIQLDCWFDNSTGNPLNPHDPPREVCWGDFSDDEMGICYFQATTHTWDDYVTLHRHATQYFASLWERYQQQLAADER